MNLDRAKELGLINVLIPILVCLLEKLSRYKEVIFTPKVMLKK